MNDEYQIGYLDLARDPDWIMEQLESYLMQSELSGEGDLPPWAIY